MRKRQDILAFDFATSRAYDEDGHLRVRSTPISKANVCGYYGREIPEWQALGLDADRVYQLLRDPAELAKAAPTFDGKPLLFGHLAVTANDHAGAEWAGTVMRPVWDAPFLLADLSCWTKVAIDGIESEEQKELSASYRYDAVMTPGVYNGTRYDGKMVNIRCNHVALVPRGRAGPDVVVADAELGAGGRARRHDPQRLAAAHYAFGGDRSPGEVAAATRTQIKPAKRWDFSAFIKRN